MWLAKTFAMVVCCLGLLGCTAKSPPDKIDAIYLEIREAMTAAYKTWETPEGGSRDTTDIFCPRFEETELDLVANARRYEVRKETVRQRVEGFPPVTTRWKIIGDRSFMSVEVLAIYRAEGFCFAHLNKDYGAP